MREYYVPGINPIIEGIKNGVEFKEIYIEKHKRENFNEELIELIRNSEIKVKMVDKAYLNSLCEIKKNQGVVGLLKDFKYGDLDSIIKNEIDNLNSRFVILDHIEDPHNFGAIIRTALCSGFSGIIIPEQRSVGVSPTVIKVSAGSVFSIPIIEVVNIKASIDTLKKNGYWIYGGDQDSEDSLFEADLSGKVGIVMGNEGKGISEIVKKSCDKLLRIPQKGNFSSLNVSVAAGVFCYEVLRKENG